jgi:hypothetical protein
MCLIQRTGLALLVVAFIGFHGCRTANQRARIAELQALAQEIPAFPDFKQVHYEDISKSGAAVVTYYYQSAAAFENVKEFYTKELSARGWTAEKQEGLWVDSSSPSTFRKGNYKIVLTRDDILMWQYTIDFSWRD